MNSGIFNVDTKSLDSLARVFGKMPKEFQYAVSRILTHIAFLTRDQSIKTINQDMTVRNAKFVASALRYSKAKPVQINSQFSEVGSITKDRFTGWVEQQSGKPLERTRVGTMLARGGDSKKQILPKNRLKPSNEILVPENMGINNAKDDEHLIIIFLQMLDRLPTSPPFLLRKPFKGFRPGLYRKTQRGIEMIQELHPKNTTVRHIPWLTDSSEKVLENNRAEKLWQDELQALIARTQGEVNK